MNSNRKNLADAIDQALLQLALHSPESDEYKEIVANIAVLSKAKSYELSGPSPDAILAASANIIGIITVLNYEKLGIVTSKAFSLITKLH